MNLCWPGYSNPKFDVNPAGGSDLKGGSAVLVLVAAEAVVVVPEVVVLAAAGVPVEVGARVVGAVAGVITVGMEIMVVVEVLAVEEEVHTLDLCAQTRLLFGQIMILWLSDLI